MSADCADVVWSNRRISSTTTVATIVSMHQLAISEVRGVVVLTAILVNFDGRLDGFQPSHYVIWDASCLMAPAVGNACQ